MARVRRDALARYPGLVWQRHVDRYHSGISDVEIVYQGMTTWCEFKFLRRWPIQVRPLVSPGFVTPLQARFLLARARAGIRSYVYVGTVAPSGALVAFEVAATALREAVVGGPSHPTLWRRDAATWLDGLIGPLRGS